MMKGFCEHVCVDRDPFPMTGSPLFRWFACSNAWQSDFRIGFGLSVCLIGIGEVRGWIVILYAQKEEPEGNDIA